MSERPPLPPIQFEALASALLARAHELVPNWCPGGVQRGHEYFCGSVQGGAGSSCAINLTTGKWCDFAGSADDRGNDLISLYAAAHGFSKQEMGKAAVQLAREEGLESVAGVTLAEPGAARPKPVRQAPPLKATPDKEQWKTLIPVPPHAPTPNFWHYHRNNSDHRDPIDHTATYMVDGQLLGYVVRFIDSSGDKETLPHTWCQSEKDGTCKWHWKTWQDPRPLYFPSKTMPKGRTVVVVEGEKKADRLHEVLEAGAPGIYHVTSWPGGGKAARKAMWNWLDDCNVILWPDCDSQREPLTKAERDKCNAEATEQAQAASVGQDEAAIAAAVKAACVAAQDAERAKKPYLKPHKQPGLSTMLTLGALLESEHRCKVQILPIPAPGVLVSGWDCADAINTDGWDINRILEFFGRAQPLPSEVSKPADAAGGGGGAKKPPAQSHAGAGEEDSGSGSGSGVMIGGKEIPWWLEPYYDHDKGRWLTSRKLVIKALQHDPELADVLGMNQLSNNIDARVGWPWAYAKAGPITGAIDLMLGDFLSRKYGLPAISRAALMEGIETVSNGRPFHPIKEWLASLKHDGVKRIEKWLIYALGETPESLKPDVFEYLQLVGRYWILGMVNRVMQPGCKFDYCPVLEGPGGYYKSTLVEVLAGTEYYSDTHFDVSKGKEGQEQVQGLWMYEIAELANFGKADIGLIKAFITAKSDRYRPSYGRVVEKFDRQCILVGTTNERTYLRDRTGNRRFWPVPVKHPIKIDWVKAKREQLLAEAYALYLAGERFTPTPEDERRLFVPIQEKRLVETAVLSEMMHILTRQPTPTGPASHINKSTAFVTISHLTTALGVDPAKSSPALEGQIRSWLEHQDWEYVKKQFNGARNWGYLRPKIWPKPEADDEPEPNAPATPKPPASPPAVTSAAGGYLQEETDDTPF